MEFMNNEFVLQFLELYQKHPVIWDACHINHKNRKCVSNAWNQIKNELSVDISVDILKKKKESLMTMYRCQKKKIADSKKLGGRKAELYKPTWFAFALMDKFLKHAGKIRETCDIKESTVSYDSEKDIDHEVIELFAVSDTPSDLVECNVDEDVATIEQARKTFLSPEKMIMRKRKQLVDTTIEKSIRQAVHALETICKKRSHPEPERDGCTLYGELVAVRLKALNQRTRKIVINKIDNMIFSAEMGEYDLIPSLL